MSVSMEDRGHELTIFRKSQVILFFPLMRNAHKEDFKDPIVSSSVIGKKLQNTIWNKTWETIYYVTEKKNGIGNVDGEMKIK